MRRHFGVEHRGKLGKSDYLRVTLRNDGNGREKEFSGLKARKLVAGRRAEKGRGVDGRLAAGGGAAMFPVLHRPHLAVLNIPTLR